VFLRRKEWGSAALDKSIAMCYYYRVMKLRNKGVPALIVTCAFAMFAVAAIPTHAKAFTYHNDTPTEVALR